jgi:hypothetical protein
MGEKKKHDGPGRPRLHADTKLMVIRVPVRVHCRRYCDDQDGGAGRSYADADGTDRSAQGPVQAA